MWTRWPGCTRSQIISAPDPRRSPAKTGPAAGQVRFSSCRAPHFLQTKKTGPSTGKIRSFWWARVDSNHRSIKQQIYSLSPLATREHALILFLSSGRIGWRLVYFTTASGVCQPVFRIFWKLFSAGRRLAAVCRRAPGLDRLLIVSSRWGFVNGQFPFFSLCGQECGSVTNFFIPLVFFQAVFYNSDIGTGGARGFCAPARPSPSGLWPIHPTRPAGLFVPKRLLCGTDNSAADLSGRICGPRSGQTCEGGILQIMDIIGQFTSLFSNFGNLTWQMLVMWIVGGLLIYLAIAK